jgi:UTP--glucose-1-phosphate uridylyltransferase
MKAIIPVAGFGSRMLPATKSIPKEMLPLVDRPLIQYIVDECYRAGIKDIIFVNHAAKQAIENHFDTQFEIESSLKLKRKNDFLKLLQNTRPTDVNIISVRQNIAKGLGHAVLCAHSVIGSEPFIVLLPDVILDSSTFDSKKDNLSAMIKRYKETGTSQVMLEEVPKSEVNKYGIGDLQGADIGKGEFAQVYSFVEKPDIEKAPSNLAVVGRYVFSAGIWDKLKNTGVGAGDEIQLTDAMDALLAEEKMEAYSMVGESHDCGDKLGYFKAFIQFALKDERFEKDLSQFLKSKL